MSLDIPSQEEFEQLLSEKSREESWAFEEAEQLLYLIQLYKLLNTSTLEPPTILDDNVLASTLKESTALLKMGLRTQKLQDISSKLSNLPKKYVASAAIALTTSTSPAITPALTMISPFAPLALAAITFLIKKKSKHQKDTKPVVLDPSEVAAYAKLHGKWLGNGEQPMPETFHTDMTNGIDKNTVEPTSNSEQNELISHPQIADKSIPSNTIHDINNCKPSTCIKDTDAAQQMTDKRWGPNRQMRACIKNYVEVEATKSDCTCLPIHMCNIVMNSEDTAGNMLISTDVLSENAALRCIKTLYIKCNLARTHKGRPPKNTCPIHSDKKLAKR